MLIDVTAGKYYLKFPSSITEKEFLDWKTKLQTQIKETVQTMLKGEDHITDRGTNCKQRINYSQASEMLTNVLMIQMTLLMILGLVKMRNKRIS